MLKNRITKVISIVMASVMTMSISAVASMPVYAAGQTVSWECSTASAPWVDKGTLTTTAWDNDTSLYINVDQTKKYQQLDATVWGGCFNERGWDAMAGLTSTQRTTIMNDLFNQSTGLKLAYGRTPMGSSDYAASAYSYDETAGDYAMNNFSISRDQQKLIPYIQAALAVNPNLKLWGVPWTPPSWMKTTNNLNGGLINPTSTNLTAYALYFAKYIKAYQALGLPLNMVMPQNEPTMNTNYSSCVWTGAQLNTFIKTYLKPTLTAQGLATDIYLGTMTDSDDTRVDPILADPTTMSYIKGFSFQWWGDVKASNVNYRNTGKSLMQSETMCGDGTNTWAYAESQFDEMKNYFDKGVSAYILWNMVLDQTGSSYAGWIQNAPITINTTTNTVVYNPQYYEYKHFSNYVNPGASRIYTSGNYGDKIAFQNTNGENVVVVKNSSASDLSVAINFNGQKIKPTIPAHSINTFRTAGTVNGTNPDKYYKLQNVNSGKLLGINSASWSDNASAIQWPDNGTTDHIWCLSIQSDGYYILANKNSGKCLGISGASTADGAQAVQWGNTGSSDHEWSVTDMGSGNYKIVNKNSGKSLGISGASTTDGASAVQGTDSGSNGQRWKLIAN